MKSQVLGVLFLLLLTGHEAILVNHAISSTQQARLASEQQHKMLTTAKLIDDMSEITPDMIISLVLGDVCYIMSKKLSDKLTKIEAELEKEHLVPKQSAVVSKGGDFLEKQAKVHHHGKIVANRRAHTKIAVIDDILAALAVIHLVFEIFEGVAKFLDGGVTAERKVALTAWLGTAEAALASAQRKLGQYKTFFETHPPSAHHSGIIRADLLELKTAIGLMSDTIETVVKWMKAAVDESNWEYSKATSIWAGIFTLGIFNGVDKIQQAINVSVFRGRAFCASEGLPALVSRVTNAQAALHQDVVLAGFQ